MSGRTHTVGWQGYADAKPSEAIQEHELPGLAVALVFPWKADTQLLNIPVKQFKHYAGRKKGARARQLAAWLNQQREGGLVLSGFFQVDTQENAAHAGLNLIQELPDTRVERHHDGWRLYFGREPLDFAQAIALVYYFQTINLGILRAGTRLPRENRTLLVAMDRFPGTSPEGLVPGARVPPTQGSKFIEFLRRRSDMGQHIESENASIGLTSRLGTLDWWRRTEDSGWSAGKSHPHFCFPDWLAASALAESHPEEFAATFKKPREGEHAVECLRELYQAFKLFDLWSASEVAHRLFANQQRWQVPPEARAYVLGRATRSRPRGRS